MNDEIRMQDVYSRRTGSLLNNSEVRRFLFCLLLTFAWGLLAHAYGFFQDSFSHDSLNALYSDHTETIWKIQLGRLLVPLYRALTRGALSLPWLTGCIALLWIGMAVYLTVRMFNFRSRGLIVLTAGIFATNLTVSGTAATYIHDLDVDMFALLAAAAAAYLWSRDNLKSLLLGTLCAAASLCLYQSYISVTIALIMFASIFALMNKEGFAKVMKRGLKAILMLLASAVIYVVLLRLVSLFGSISTDTETYNSVQNAFSHDLKSLLRGVLNAYLGWGYFLLKAETAYPQPLMALLRLLLFASAAISFLAVLFQRKQYNAGEKLLALVLCILLPLGMNLSCMLGQGVYHYLMSFPVWLTYLLVLMIAYWTAEQPGKKLRGRNALRKVSIVLVALMLWGNVQVANTMYLKKDLEEEATLSLMTRVVDHMEEQPDYIPGETPVVFVGMSALAQPVPGTASFNKIVGMFGSGPISISQTTPTFNAYDAYFKYILRYPARMCNSATWNAMQADPRAVEMPSFPAKGSMKMLDDVFIVKMG